MGGQYNTCSAPNCTNSRSRISNLPMFRVPKDPIRSKEWITNSGRKELLLKDPNYLYDNIRFCAYHFEDSQFTNSNKNRLIWKAVPTIFSYVGLDETKISDYQFLVDHIEPERNTNRTFIVLKKLCLSKQKSLKRDFKPTILRGKCKALRQIGRQPPTKSIETKKTTNPTHKVELLTKLASQGSECKLSVKRIGNETILNPTGTNKIQIKLSPSENNSLFILNSGTLEHINKVDRGCTVKRKLRVQQINSLNRNSNLMKTKLETLQLNKCQSSAKYIETKDTTNPTDGIGIQGNDQGKSLANYIETEETKNEVDMQENKGQYSTNHTETKVTTNISYEADIQDHEGQSSLNHTETKGPTNFIDKVNNLENECPSSEDTEGTTIQIDKADRQENEGQSSANHSEIRGTSPPTNIANEGQFSTNRTGFKGTTNHTDNADLQENEGQTLNNHIETNNADIQENKGQTLTNYIETNTTDSNDKVNSQENKGQSPANCIEAKGTIKTTDEVNIQDSEGKAKANHIETKECTNPSNGEGLQEIDGHSSANDNVTTGTPNSTNEAVIQESEGQSSTNQIESISTTNSTNEVDTQTKSDPQIKEHESSVLSSSVKQMYNKMFSNPTDKFNVKSHSSEINSLVLNCDSSQNKNKITAVKRKLSLLKNNCGKRIQRSKPAILKKKLETLKENECLSSVLSSIKQMTDDKGIPDSTENVQTESSLPGSSNTLLINDDFSQYKKRVEDFKKKLCSPNFNTVNNPFKRKFETIKGSECVSSLGLKQTKFKRIIKSDGIGDLQIKSDSQNIVCTPSVSYFETKSILNPSHKIQTKPISPQNNSLIINVEVTKYKKKLEACEKVIDGLKSEHKSEVRKLRKVIKELRRRTHRKDFLISKLRKERKELRDGLYYERPNSKPNFQRDRHLIEQIMSKYVSRDTLNIVMSQIKKHTKKFGNRWDDEVKMFALNILKSSPKAYKILCSYLNLPSTRTLQKFVQGADLMALSGLNYKISSDFADNEDDTLPKISSVVNADTRPNEDITDPEMISSTVELESEDIIIPEFLISQDTGKENEGQIIYVVTGTDNECEVITADWIPVQDSNL